MAEQGDTTTREKGEAQGRQSAQPAMRPAVNIFEDAQGITVEADMPGVSKDRLNVQIDKDTLLVEGDARIDMPEGMEAIYADVRATHYRRTFTLSGELETNKVDASLKDGVLTLHIPKRVELQPRKIEVRVG
jgi:HSP20 family protein